MYREFRPRIEDLKMSGFGGNKVILVTGGGGYIGSHCVLSLLKNGYEVVVIDNFSNCQKGPGGQTPASLLKVAEMTGKNIPFYHADLTDLDTIKVPFQKHRIDCVMHFGALKAVAESMQKPLEYYYNNVTGTCNLLRAMKEFGVNSLVFSSSSSVYGLPQYLPLDENHGTGVDITSNYGRTKYFCEQMMTDAARIDPEMRVVFLRYFNPIGNVPTGEIGEDPVGPPNNLLPYISQVAVGRREHLNVFGNDYKTPDGSGVRDYIHVVDLAEGHTLSLKQIFDKAFNGTKAYNLGTGRGYSVLEIVAAFEKASGVKIPVKFCERRVGDIDENYASAALAEKELNWKCQYGLEDMCKHVWNFQSKNPNGLGAN